MVREDKWSRELAQIMEPSETREKAISDDYVGTTYLKIPLLFDWESRLLRLRAFIENPQAWLSGPME